MQPATPYYKLTFGVQNFESYATWSLYYAEAEETGPDDSVNFALLNAAYEIFEDPYKAVMSDETFWSYFNLRRHTSTTVQDFSYNFDGDPTPGILEAADVLPADSAVCIQRKSAYSGRSKSGRVFVPFVPEEQTLASLITEDALPSWAALGNAIGQPLNSGSTFLYPAVIDWQNGLILGLSRVNVDRQIKSRMDRRTEYPFVGAAFSGTSPLD